MRCRSPIEADHSRGDRKICAHSAQRIGKNTPRFLENPPIPCGAFLAWHPVRVLRAGVLGRVHDPTGLAVMSAKILLLIALLAPIVIVAAGIAASRKDSYEPNQEP